MDGLDKKAQQIFASIMVAAMVLILIVIISPVLKDETVRATNTTNINISNPNISVPNKATAIILDMTLFYFIGILIASSIAFITGKKSITGAVTAIMVFVVANILISPLKEFIILIRDSGHLDCTNAAITVGGKLACIAIDLWLFYFVVTALSVAVALIFVKKVLPQR